MTHDQKLLAIWCAGAGVVLLVIGLLFASRDAELDATRAKADALHADYLQLYPEQGTTAEEALAGLKRLRDHQEQARASAERDLLGMLPEEYQRGDVTEASSRLRADLGALKQRAERQKIVLPKVLPFESTGFDQAKVSLQLAQLYLYRQVLDLCMDASVASIDTVTVREGRGHRDPSGVYAVLTCEFAIAGNYESVSQLLIALRAKHGAGLGVRELKLSQQAAQTMQCTLVASLLTANNPQWQLGAENAPAAAKTGAAAPARRTRQGGG